ncbi:MAG TPA: hypothetical protein VH144_00120 [Candidatus Saccharimonadales bacterium]|jgi:hypothetical protein|nr:hypothetical protein [Candidatus Saccharimonadales bacterium]
MKKNDMALIILIVSISLLVSYFVGKAIIGEPKKQSTQVEVVEPITSNVTDPSPLVFNKDAINPTVPIQIGNPSNQQPF